jgi:hydroxypyruvate reductase
MKVSDKIPTGELLQAAEPALERRRQALEILGAALAAVDPLAAVHQALSFDPTGNMLVVGGREFPLDPAGKLIVVGAGKAGTPMAQAVAAILGERLSGGIVTVKYGYGPVEAGTAGPIQFREAGHPVLDQAGIAATAEITGWLAGLTERDTVLALISGGGSALLEEPVAGVSLADMQELTAAMLKSGATINQMNAIRKHLSRVKGGQLARLAAPARLIGLLLSDVVGSPLDVIASGPTVPDTTTFQEAWAILQRLGLAGPGNLPESIRRHLQQGLAGLIPETPKPGDRLFERVHTVVVGDNRLAAQAGLAKARQLGFNTLLLSTFIEGEAREVARVLAGVAREVLETGNPVKRPACLIAGGETTVTVRGDGLGGRNQELGLAAALAIEGLDNVLIVPLATDGGDGPTDAAGAFAGGDTVRQARNHGLDPFDYLQRNDSYHFFEQVGGLLKTGPTNTNVNDLTLILVW